MRDVGQKAFGKSTLPEAKGELDGRYEGLSGLGERSNPYPRVSFQLESYMKTGGRGLSMKIHTERSRDGGTLSGNLHALFLRIRKISHSSIH